jgi:LysM repeat protein
MIGNSFNLVDSIRGHLSDTFTNRLSLLLGESHEKTQTALHAAVPGILSELDTATTTTDGASRLATAIDDSDDMVLDNFSGIFGKDFSSDSIVNSFRSAIGGGRYSEFTSNLGRTSGLSLRSITSLLGVLIPVVFGVIKRTLRSRAMKSADIASLLATQRANVAAALPTGFSRRFTEETYATPRDTARRRELDEPARESSASRWLLPLVGIAAAIGLLWYLASRPVTHQVRDARTTTGRTIPSQDLTRKYQSVINEAESQGVQLSSVRTENGTLMLKGTAPSQEAVNKVWNEITRVNPKHDDIVADLSVGTSRATPFVLPSVPDGTRSAADIEKDKTARLHDDQASTVTRQKPSDITPSIMPDKDNTTTVTREKSSDVTGSRMYTVKRGDTLGSISRQFYGNTRDYTKIVDANSGRIKNPNLIQVGEELMIPER